MGRLERLRPWRSRGATGEGFPLDPVTCRWRFPRSRVENPSHVLLFYRDELDRMSFAQFVWGPYSNRVLQDYPQALEESQPWRAVIPMINFEVVDWHRLD